MIHAASILLTALGAVLVAGLARTSSSAERQARRELLELREQLEHSGVKRAPTLAGGVWILEPAAGGLQLERQPLRVLEGGGEQPGGPRPPLSAA